MTRIDIVSTTPVDEAQEEFLPYYLGSTPEEAEDTYKIWSGMLSLMSTSYALNTGSELEDYFAESIKGLARAKRDWDPTRGGCNIRTFIILKVKNALNEFYRKSNSIVSIPHYVRVAHTYITNIKTILEGYGVCRSNIIFVLKGGECIRFDMFADADYDRIVEELRKLTNLIKNTGVRRADLIDRAEFVPSDMEYDESMSQGELHKREQRRLAAALMVSKMEDHMTAEELHIAHGIMTGHSYAEIGRTHDPKRSIAWVQKKVDEMRTKFKAKVKEGL